MGAKSSLSKSSKSNSSKSSLSNSNSSKSNSSKSGRGGPPGTGGAGPGGPIVPVDNLVKKKLLEFLGKHKEEEEEIRMCFESAYGIKMNIDELSIILSDKEEFKKAFFSDSYKLKILKHIDELMEGVEDAEEYSQKEIDAFKDRIHSNLENLNKSNNLTYLLRPVSWTENCNFLTKKIANFITKNKNKYPDGAMHAALSLNGKIFEWGYTIFDDLDDLVIPHPNYEQIFNISFELEESFWKKIKNFFKQIMINFINFFTSIFSPEWKLKTVHEMEIDKICEICVKYNNYYFYDKEKRNCQGFVRKITDSLEINLCFEGEMNREFQYFIKILN